jgi:hypothetical protein
LLNRILSELRFARNPVLYVAVALAVLITVLKVASGTPLAEVLTADYAEQLMVLVGGIITRFLVYAPTTVKADEDAFVSVDLSDMKGGDGE